MFSLHSYRCCEETYTLWTSRPWRSS